MPRYTVYRNRGRFITEREFNRLKSRGVNGTVKRTYVTRNEVIDDISDVFEYEDYDDLVDYEYHGTGDTGKRE